MNSLQVVELGTMGYGAALELQRAVALARIEGRIEDDVLLLVEHPPVVTMGRSSRNVNLLSSPEFLASRGVEVFEVERGGDVTFHGPGQLVGYPILDLKEHRQDLHWYLRQMEEALIRLVRSYGLQSTRNPGFTGVWTAGRDGDAPDVFLGSNGDAGPTDELPAPVGAQNGMRKIASIGVHVRDWVTWHGFALNVTTDLSFFDLIVPCGIADVRMTSLSAELGGAAIPLSEVGQRGARVFAEVFGLEPTSATIDELTVSLSAESGAEGQERES